MAGQLRIRPMRETRAELELFKACFDANGLPKDLDALHWRFLDNPTGRLLVDFAVDGERVAAIYGEGTMIRAELYRKLANPRNAHAHG